jgi:hypothetical protein
LASPNRQASLTLQQGPVSRQFTDPWLITLHLFGTRTATPPLGPSSPCPRGGGGL